MVIIIIIGSNFQMAWMFLNMAHPNLFVDGLVPLFDQYTLVILDSLEHKNSADIGNMPFVKELSTQFDVPDLLRVISILNCSKVDKNALTSVTFEPNSPIFQLISCILYNTEEFIGIPI